MRTWQHRLRIADVFHDESRTFEQRRDEIVRRIRSAGFYALPSEWDLVAIVDDLADTESVDDFDFVWDEFYNWCDVSGVWVETRIPIAASGGPEQSEET